MIIGLSITVFVLGIILWMNLKQNKKTSLELMSEIDSKKKEVNFKIEEVEKLTSDLKKYQGIISIEQEIEIKKSEFNKTEIQSTELAERYLKAKSIYDELENDIQLYRTELEFVELGIYEPIFNFETSDQYKQELLKIRNSQKELIKAGKACICHTEWVVGNSRKQGEIMTRRYINLTLRAFNGECDALISKVRWNNVQRFEERITRAFKAINKLGKSNNTFITDQYLRLKLDELHLAYELEHKKYQEKEEQREIRAAQREEERSLREFEKARKQAEAEEKRFQKALEMAKKDLGLVSGKELEKLNNEIASLQMNLKEAHEAKERAISRAQETKSGHVYVISNIGSFGENIFKIGMTRRLEPMDRVKELGDASVPFRFDLHALIFTENAPELENLLQKEFHDRRINKVNYRKEYFRVSLDEIESVIKEKYDEEVDFIKIPEAKEYRETQSIIKKIESQNGEAESQQPQKYPDTLL